MSPVGRASPRYKHRRLSREAITERRAFAKLVAGEEFTHTEQNQIRYWQEYAVTYPEDVRKDFGDIRMYVGF